MFHFPTIPIKYLVQNYGPLFTAGATIAAATVAAFAARAAMRSARASELNVATAQMSMELGNRAYISLTKQEFSAIVTAGEVPRLNITIVNVGKTLAQQIQVRLRMDIFDKDFGLDIPDASVVIDKLSLAPGQDLRFQAFLEEPLTDEELKSLDGKTSFLFFWGIVQYRDVFDRQHTTMWCSKYECKSPKQLVVHPHHNGMT
jgi:hypothetical protein